MGAFFIYILKSAVCLVLFYLFFKLFEIDLVLSVF